MKKRDYVLGRFLGALLVAFLLMVAVAIAILAGSKMPWLEPERVGPFYLMPYLFTLGVLVLPNLLLTGALFFSLAARTRSMLWTYAGVIGFFVCYFISRAWARDLQSQDVAALLDPFGVSAVIIATKYWTVAEKNAPTLPLDHRLLLNRLLWSAIAIAIFGYTLLRFRLVAARAAAASRKQPEIRPDPVPATAAAAAQAPAERRFGPLTSLRQFLLQARLEVIGIFKSAPFLVIGGFGVINIVGNSIGQERLFGTPVWPVTHLMVTTIEGAYGLVVVLILTFYAGEAVWRERSLKLDGVYDSLPVPGWVFWGAKLLALLVVVLLLLSAAIVTGIGIQAWRGYHDFELALYVKGLLLNGGYAFALIAVLTLFLQVVANHKYLGFLLIVVYYVSFPVLDELDLGHNLYRYAGTPESPYSDMNGYGHFVRPLVWFNLYWTFAAVALIVLTALLWVRGVDTAPGARLRLARQRFGAPARAALAVAALGFAATGAYIYYNTNVLNEYVPVKMAQARQAEFEKKYKRYEQLDQPRIAAVRSEVDLFPERREATIRGTYTLVNRHDQPIPALHLWHDPKLKLTVDLPGSAPEMDDAVLGYSIRKLDPPLAPGEERELRFTVEVRHPGFVNNDSDTHLVGNGTFLGSQDYFPHLGYNHDLELADPNERRKNGLPPLVRLPKLEDEKAHRDNCLTNEADWLQFETTVSTSPDQIAIAPGYLQREWNEGGRRYFHYKMDAPIHDLWAYLSGRYAVKRDRWNDVAIEVYYHPAHPYNVDRMIDGVKKSLDYYTRNFGPYQHRQMRIMEFPRYASFAQSLPNTVPFSESIGFIARIREADDIDYPFYVTAHEVAHQWWAHQTVSANVQGAAFLAETLSQYSALMVMEKEYGPEQMRKFLKYELDNYLRGRGGERLEELPLVRVESQPYVYYRKGSVAMYALRDAIGEEAMNRALAKLLAATRFQQPPYTDSRALIALIRAETPPDRANVVEDLLETITLWDDRAVSASATQGADGKYTVKLALAAKKLRASGTGVETEVPLDDWIDVGVLARPKPGSKLGEPLLLEKRHLTTPTADVTLTVDAEPWQAGIDPLNKLIDRNPEDNLVRVTIEAGK